MPDAVEEKPKKKRPKRKRQYKTGGIYKRGKDI